MYFYKKTRTNPEGVNQWVLDRVKALLPEGYDMANASRATSSRMPAWIPRRRRSPMRAKRTHKSIRTNIRKASTKASMVLTDKEISPVRAYAVR